MNIETNNDEVLYNLMLNFLKRKAEENRIQLEDLALQIDEESKSIDLHHYDNGNYYYLGKQK